MKFRHWTQQALPKFHFGTPSEVSATFGTKWRMSINLQGFQNLEGFRRCPHVEYKACFVCIRTLPWTRTKQALYSSSVKKFCATRALFLKQEHQVNGTCGAALFSISWRSLQPQDLPVAFSYFSATWSRPRACAIFATQSPRAIPAFIFVFTFIFPVCLKLR